MWKEIQNLVPMSEQSNHKLEGSFIPLPVNKNHKKGIRTRGNYRSYGNAQTKKAITGKCKKRSVISRKMYQENYAASKKDADQVEVFAHEHGLTTVEVSLPRRSIVLRGALSGFEAAFNTSVQKVNNFRAPASVLKIPASLC